MDPLFQRNVVAQARALKAGAAFFTKEIVEHWPACSTCAEPIRHRPEVRARTCACPGVTWRFTGVIGLGPERVEPADT